MDEQRRDGKDFNGNNNDDNDDDGNVACGEPQITSIPGRARLANLLCK